MTYDAESGFCLFEAGYYIAYLPEDTLLGTDTFALRSGLLSEFSPMEFDSLFNEPFPIGQKRECSNLVIYKNAFWENNMTYWPSRQITVTRTSSGFSILSRFFTLPYRNGAISARLIGGRPAYTLLTGEFQKPAQDTIFAQLRWIASDDTLGTDLAPPLDFVFVKKIVKVP